MKILVHINHFFGSNSYFKGKSSVYGKNNSKDYDKKKLVRKEKLSKVISSLETLSDSVSIRLCGYDQKSILPLDIDFLDQISNPTEIMYASLSEMEKDINNFDYFINIEDDILLTKATFERVVKFDRISLINEILHPNRIEYSLNNKNICIDIKSIPGWNYNQKLIFNHEFRSALNPHSGIAIFSQKKLKYAFQNSDIKIKNIHLYAGMDSAFASIHSCFILWRSYDSIDFHSIEHLDKWTQPPSDILSGINKYDFIPMVVPKIIKYIYLILRNLFNKFFL